MNDKRDDEGLHRQLTGTEAFAHLLPVLAFVGLILLAILLPKTDLTRAIFGGWNAAFIVFAVLGGAVWWSNRLLQRESDQSNDSEGSNGA